VDRTRAAIRLGEVMNRPLASQGYSSFERTMMPEASEAESGMPYGMASKATDRPAYAQAEAFLAEMRQRKQAEQSTLDQLTAETRSMAHSWLKELDIAKREVTLVREIVLPQNRSAYETSLSGYSSDRINFLDLLDAERALINARLELDAARRDLNQTMVRYANVTGRLPNRE
jgi:outer membrane protein TolC